MSSMSTISVQSCSEVQYRERIAVWYTVGTNKREVIEMKETIIRMLDSLNDRQLKIVLAFVRGLC